MEEIEVKILEVPADTVIARLVRLGGRPDGEMVLQALYFDTPGGELGRRKDSLRLRREGERVLLNYKAHRPSPVMKIKDEYETVVGDLQTARRILEGLGYVVWFELEKRRRGYVLDTLPGVHYVFDRFLGAHAEVPELLEIEAPAPELLRSAVEAIGYTLEQTVAWNAFEVVQHYRRFSGSSPSRDAPVR